VRGAEPPDAWSGKLPGAVPSFASPLTGLLRAYLRTGADPPFGDPSGYHGVGMEGHFWRFTQPASGEVVIVIAAISRDAAGLRWGMACMASHPGAALVTAVAPAAWAHERRLGLRLTDGERTLLAAGPDRLEVDLGPGARLTVELDGRRGWGRRAVGGIGPAQVVPGLSQYWHPHVLHATARGSGVLGGRRLALAGASAYAEKNWGAGGMPPAWWWGQAHGFEDDEVCVAFAGGHAGAGPLHVTAGALVVALPGEVLRVVRPLQPLRVDVGATGWRLRARTSRGWAVDVEGHAAGSAPHHLPVPVPAQRRVIEASSAQHLAGTLALVVRRGRRTRFRGVSELAGLECGRGH
jgi:tocopherol cyclase